MVSVTGPAGLQVDQAVAPAVRADDHQAGVALVAVDVADDAMDRAGAYALSR